VLPFGVHSTRVNVDAHDLRMDEALEPTCASYADLLLAQTAG
jgi:hypothetical protein